ncbi:response regulator transcription factor [Microbacterium fluvii]|uniref:Response regulator transcription factor n=1 Tax=Microbacterium fluvii TaxID=415215 RepID=A0ABW2HEQ0_9MICO|nr:LuxR C-terminal-related transcriptional regulator [Microbacterium fluvii]MCU4671867.1 LuxR C-terminal-related transcriptional regulator [Microbacterium fluvii]
MPPLAESVSDAQLVSSAVETLAKRTRFPVAFGGLEHDGSVHVSAIFGGQTRTLEGLVVRASRGLGGRALVEKRARLALDYGSSRSITHDYDRAVLGEHISTLFAVPVVVSGRARAVLYCGSRGRAPVGDVVAQPALAVAEELATELRVRDEVARRMSLIPARTDALPAAAVEELRETYAELRSIGAELDDPALRSRLAALEARVAGLSSPPAAADLVTDVHLAPRELDVLARAGLGETNAEIGLTLGLKEGTVKSYLQSAMAKLDASTRHAAVAKARRVGILP